MTINEANGVHRYSIVAAGRTYCSDVGTKIFLSGANATITGDMLTTVGNNTDQDKIMLTKLGFDIKKIEGE